MNRSSSPPSSEAAERDPDYIATPRRGVAPATSATTKTAASASASVLQSSDASRSSESRKIKLYPSSHVTTSTTYTTSTDSRGFIPVFEYSLRDQNIMIDRETGFVHLTGIWKALGKSKADIVKLVESEPKIASSIRKVRGGYLKIQGTWVPYEIAESLARRVAWEIRDDLVPLFGPAFPASCLAPGDAGFGQLVLSSPDETRPRRETGGSRTLDKRASAKKASQAALNNSSVPTSSQARAGREAMESLARNPVPRDDVTSSDEDEDSIRGRGGERYASDDELDQHGTSTDDGLPSPASSASSTGLSRRVRTSFYNNTAPPGIATVPQGRVPSSSYFNPPAAAGRFAPYPPPAPPRSLSPSTFSPHPLPSAYAPTFLSPATALGPRGSTSLSRSNSYPPAVTSHPFNTGIHGPTGGGRPQLSARITPGALVGVASDHHMRRVASMVVDGPEERRAMFGTFSPVERMRVEFNESHIRSSQEEEGSQAMDVDGTDEQPAAVNTYTRPAGTPTYFSITPPQSNPYFDRPVGGGACTPPVSSTLARLARLPTLVTPQPVVGHSRSPTLYSPLPLSHFDVEDSSRNPSSTTLAATVPQLPPPPPAALANTHTIPYPGTELEDGMAHLAWQDHPLAPLGSPDLRFG